VATKNPDKRRLSNKKTSWLASTTRKVKLAWAPFAKKSKKKGVRRSAGSLRRHLNFHAPRSRDVVKDEKKVGNKTAGNRAGRVHSKTDTQANRGGGMPGLTESAIRPKDLQLCDSVELETSRKGEDNGIICKGSKLEIAFSRRAVTGH